MNTIPEAQLERSQLDRLAAARYLYSRAKMFQGWQLFLSVPCVVGWAFTVLLIPEWRAWAALWGIVITVLDAVALERGQQCLREKAARVQELFDCAVLQLEWQELKTGRRPEVELIEEFSERYRNKDPQYQALLNWYAPAVGELPLHLGRLICQRSNCWWDAKLRRRYALAMMIGLGLLALLVITLSLAGGFTLERFILAGLAPLMPAVTLAIRQAYDHSDAAAKSDHLRECTENLWDEALRGVIGVEELEVRSRQLQNEIFERRRRSPLIFDWIYRRLRRTNEDQMNKGAEALVKEALQYRGRTAGGT